MASAEIGSTGLSVTRLGLGGAGPPGGSFHGTTAAAAHATLERAYELVWSVCGSTPSTWCSLHLLGDTPHHYQQALHEALPALAEIRSQGMVRAIGVGTTTETWEMLAPFAQEGGSDCFLVASRYTLMDHSALEQFLPLCLERRIGGIGKATVELFAKEGARVVFMARGTEQTGRGRVPTAAGPARISSR